MMLMNDIIGFKLNDIDDKLLLMLLMILFWFLMYWDYQKYMPWLTLRYVWNAIKSTIYKEFRLQDESENNNWLKGNTVIPQVDLLHWYIMQKCKCKWWETKIRTG